jgi:hypothetical protein
MKRLIASVLLAAGALAAAAPALANEDCQAGSAWGAKEGCGGPQQYGVPMGTPQSAPVPRYPYAYGQQPQVAPQLRNERQFDRRYGRQDERQYDGRSDRRYDGRYDRREVNPTRGDRDGDGVANRQDRYPSDPSRW